MKVKFDVYTIIENGDSEKKNFWCKIGIAFLNQDNSINVKLNALPINGQLQLREQVKEDN